MTQKKGFALPGEIFLMPHLISSAHTIVALNKFIKPNHPPGGGPLYKPHHSQQITYNSQHSHLGKISHLRWVKKSGAANNHGEHHTWSPGGKIHNQGFELITANA